MANFIKVRINFPSDADEVLGMIDNESISKMIKAALRTAAVPIKNHMKAIIRTEMLVTNQSTGATERSIDTKIGRSKQHRGRFYILVGVNKDHYEVHSNIVPTGLETKRKQGKRTGSGFFGLQHRRMKNGNIRSRQVFSTYKTNKHFRRYSRTGVLRRRPTKYFHLINNGFDHRFGVRAKAYDILGKTEVVVMGVAQQVFEQRINELVMPTITKEIERKVSRG